MDTGNFTDNPTPEGDVKTRALVGFMGRIGYRAAGLGERDLDRGYEYLDSLRKLGGFSFVSANTVYQRTGKPVFDPYTVVTLSPKEFGALKGKPVKVGITSFIRFNPTFLKPSPSGDNMILSNALDEAKHLIPELRAKCDLLVVLAEMPKDDAHLIARTVKGIDLIIAGYAGMISGAEEKEGTTRIVYIGNQGKYLAEIRAMRGSQSWELSQTMHYLGATYPEEAKAKDAVSSVLNQINETNKKIALERASKSQSKGGPLAAPAAAAAGGARTYLGSEACKDCHSKEYEIWKMSKHAHAFDILVQKKADFNPECVGCHVVGYHARGGFEDAKNTPDLIHVQCESCHGPAADHPQNPTAPYGKAGGAAACAPCHKLENSPTFEFTNYWAKIQH